jgi:hypothetical protein
MTEEVKQERRNTYDDEDLYELFKKHRFHHKRMISWSKSRYRNHFQNHDIWFNLNLFTPSGIWWNGDVDLTIDNLTIQRICNELGEEIIAVQEMLGWQGAQEKSYDELKEHAHAIFTPNKRYYQVRKYDGIHAVTSGTWTTITNRGVAWYKVRVRKWSQSKKR